MGTGTASANPARLDAAARAVPDETRARLASASATLSERIAAFNRGTQSPERIRVSADLLAGAVARAVGVGEELDARLVRTAAAFRAAGAGQPPAFTGPALPGLMFLDDARLEAEIAAWTNCPWLLTFDRRGDGTLVLLGPDSQEYVMRDAPPPGALPLGASQDVVDLGNPEFGFGQAASITVGLAGGQVQRPLRYPPPEAYEHIRLASDGRPVLAGAATPVGEPVPGMPPDGPAEPPGGNYGWSAIASTAQVGLAGFREGMKFRDMRWRNVVRAQATYYVDPTTGERVAVVDAARIQYDDGANEAIVTSGRLSISERGRPVLIEPPPDNDPDAPACPTGPPTGPPRTLRVPLEEE